MTEFNSGFSISIQASKRNYCSPRVDDCPEGYESVELGFPSEREELIIQYAENPDIPTETVYGWVPAGVIKALIIKHGGVKSGSVPPLENSLAQNFILAEKLEGCDLDS